MLGLNKVATDRSTDSDIVVVELRQVLIKATPESKTIKLFCHQRTCESYILSKNLRHFVIFHQEWRS